MAKETKKICPLTHSTGKGPHGQEVSDFDFCCERQCAWWYHTERCCSLKLIAEDLNHIAGHSKFK